MKIVDALYLFVLLGWRNIWRQRRKSYLVISAAMVGIMGMLLLIAMINGLTKVWVGGAIESGLGHLQLRPKGYRERRGQKMLFEDPKGLLELTERIEPELRDRETALAIPGIRYAHRFERQGFLRLGSEIQGVGVIGVDAERERSISKFDDWLIAGAYFEVSPEQRERDRIYGVVPCVLGRANAEKFEVGTGETLVLSISTAEASTHSVKVRVEGIFEAIAEPIEKHTLLLPREALSQMFNGSLDQISYSVYISSDRRLAGDLQEKLTSLIADSPQNSEAVPSVELLSYQELQPGITKLLETTEQITDIFYFIMLSGFAFVLLNSITMSVFERTREIGILRAIGSPGYFLFLTVVFESLLLGLIGASAGSLASAALVSILAETGISFELFARGLERMGGVGARIYPDIKPSDYLIGYKVTVAISFIASIYPAYRAIKVTPVKAIYGR